MIALLLAAQLTGAPPLAPQTVVDVRSPLFERGRCGLWDAQPIKRRNAQPRIQSLGELPRANHELAVMRLGPDGCSKPVVVRRNVQGDGRFPAPRR
jgi:hypothetical protein